MFATTLNQSVGSLSYAYSIVEPRLTPCSRPEEMKRNKWPGKWLCMKRRNQHRRLVDRPSVRPFVYAIFAFSHFIFLLLWPAVVVDTSANISSAPRNVDTVPIIRRINALIVGSISLKVQKSNGLCTNALNPFLQPQPILGSVAEAISVYVAIHFFFSSNAVERWSIARNHFGYKNIAEYRAYH